MEHEVGLAKVEVEVSEPWTVEGLQEYRGNLGLGLNSIQPPIVEKTSDKTAVITVRDYEEGRLRGILQTLEGVTVVS